MNVAIVGTRHPVTGMRKCIAKVLAELSDDDAVVTGCADGVDREVRDQVLYRGRLVLIVCHAPWGAHGRAAGPIRNAKIEQIAACVIAFPDMNSRGTWDTVARFEAAKKPVTVIALAARGQTIRDPKSGRLYDGVLAPEDMR